MNLEKVDDFLTVKELSKWIKLSESHIYFLVNKRKIPFAKLGGKLLFDKQKIKDWIDANSPSTEQPEHTINAEVVPIPEESVESVIKRTLGIQENQIDSLEKNLKEESNFDIQ